MQTSYRHGALQIIETVRPKDEILRALKQIDDRLFLERQITIDGQAVWCVVVDVGSGEPPMTIIEWRDSDGHPIHQLSSGIIDRVARMERDSGRLSATIVKKNAARLEAKKRDTNAHWADLGTEFEKRLSPGYSAVLHRSQSLRMARDKKRNRGELR